MKMKGFLVLFTLCWSALCGAAFAQAPANNNYANAITLSGVSGSTNGDNTGATLQGVERPPFNDNTNDNTVWYKWTAPQNGQVTFDLTGTSVDTVMSIYTGSALASLVLVDENDDGVDIGSVVTFTATAGVTYSIQIAGLGGSANGEEGPFPIVWSTFNAAGTFAFSAATASVNEQDGVVTLEINRLGGTTGNVNITYSTANGTAFSTQDYTDTTQTLTFLDGDDFMTVDIPITNDPDFEIPETFTVTLSGATGGSDIGVPSAVTVTIISDELPPNDNFANAEVITGNSGSIGGNDASSTQEAGPEDTLGPVVWYKWVAPIDGAVAFSLNSPFTHFAEILRGPGLAALQFVSDGALRKTAAVSVIAGTTYYIAVGGAQNAFTLNWQTTTTGVFELAGLRSYTDPTTGREVGRYVGGENGGSVPIVIRRTGALAGTVSVNLNASEDSTAEFGFQNATNGSDFTATGVNVVFGSGESVKTVQVPILNDPDAEPTEDLVVSLSTPTNGSVLGNVSRVQLQLFDDEADPANDDLANAQSIFGPSGQVAGNNTEADPEATEPPFSSTNSAGNTIWYRWMAPLSGTTQFAATVDDGFGGVPAVVDVFISTVTGLVPVASSATSPLFAAVSGQTYLVRVDGTVSDQIFGQTSLTWSIATGGLVSFSSSQVSRVRETNADVTFAVTVQRTGDTQNGATVDIVTADDTATADVTGTPGDYVGVAQTLVFSAGETSKTVNITIHGDAVPEGDELFSVSLINPTGALLSGTTTLDATIEDDDDDPANDAFANRIALAVAPGSLAGTNVGAGTETGEPSHGFNSVWYGWAPGAAGLATVSLNGTSAMSLPTVTIYTGTTLGGLTRVAQGIDTANFVADATTTYIIAITEGDDVSGSPDAFTLTTALDVNGSLLTISAASLSVSESASSAFFTVTRSGSLAGSSSFDVTFTDDTAVAPGDYSGVSGTIYFGPGETTKGINAPFVNDALVEGDEDFIVTISNITGAVLASGDPTDVVVTIRDDDDDPAPPANDNFANAATLAGNTPVVGGYSDGATTEAGEPGSPNQSLWYQWTASANGVAAVALGDAGHSFNIFTGTTLGNLAPVSYLTGTTFAAVSGTTYFVQVNAAASATSPNFVLSLNFTNAGVFSIGSSGLVVNEDGGSATITILRSNGSAGAVSVRFRALGITATAGSDFTAVDQVVNFAAGVTSQTVNVPILNDAAVEGEESVRLVLSDPVGGAIIAYAPTDVVALTINDDEDDPSNDDLSNAVALSGPFGSTSDNNAGASRQSGEPIHASAATGASIWFLWTAPATGTVTFDTTGSAIPTALAAYTGSAVDALTELASNTGNPSTLSFSATGGASYAIVVDSSSAARGDVTLNWDLVLPGVFSFSPVSYSALESATNVVLTVTRAVGADGPVSVHFATADGTATAGQDYTATSGDLNFADGETTKTITVPLLNDTAFEIAEAFTVALSAPTNGAALGVSTTATVTLTSNDPFTASAVNFAALVNPGGTHATAGLLTITESATASFTGKLLLGGKSYAIKGSFDAFGNAIVTVPRKGLTTLAIAMQLDDGGQTLAGHVYDGAFDSAFAGEASFYNGTTQIYPQAGAFTLALLPTSTASGIPQGIGTATMTVDTKGVFKIKGGQLGDANSLSATGFISQSGQAQFYSLLYSGQGSLAGVVNFRNQMTTDADATLRWLKPANAPKQKYFLPGFDTNVSLNASFFTAPAANTRIDTAFDANNGATDIALRNGNLSGMGLDASGLLDTKNKLSVTTPFPLTLSGNSKTGQFTGSFTPVGGKKTSFKGVFLQKSDQALGQFFGVSQSGSVTVQPD